MSLEATRWAWDQECPTPASKLTLLALANRCGRDGTCYPSLACVARDTGLARSTVADALNRLERAGLIARQRGRTGRATTYRLASPGAGLGSPRIGLGSPGAGLALVREPDPNQSIEPVMNQSENLSRARTRESGEPHEENTPVWMRDEEPRESGATSASETPSHAKR